MRSQFMTINITYNEDSASVRLLHKAKPGSSNCPALIFWTGVQVRSSEISFTSCTNASISSNVVSQEHMSRTPPSPMKV
jgi:hypothetical protein